MPKKGSINELYNHPTCPFYIHAKNAFLFFFFFFTVFHIFPFSFSLKQGLMIVQAGLGLLDSPIWFPNVGITDIHEYVLPYHFS